MNDMLQLSVTFAQGGCKSRIVVEVQVNNRVQFCEIKKEAWKVLSTKLGKSAEELKQGKNRYMPFLLEGVPWRLVTTS